MRPRRRDVDAKMLQLTPRSSHSAIMAPRRHEHEQIMAPEGTPQRNYGVISISGNEQKRVVLKLDKFTNVALETWFLHGFWAALSC